MKNSSTCDSLDAPESLASRWVLLADGSHANLVDFDRLALHRLQLEQERAFAQKILAAPKGSAARHGDCAGYDTVCSILDQLRGGDVVMGFDSRYAQLVIGLLRGRATQPAPALFEIGYGAGFLLAAVAKAGFPVAGIEVSETIRQRALEMVPHRFHDKLYLGDFLTYSLCDPERRFDVVYWNDVLEHVPPDEVGDFLSKIREILRPGGCLVTITPSWHERPSDVTGDFSPPRTEAQGLHLKEYTLREVTTLLRQAGFVRMETPLCVLPQGIYRYAQGLAGVKRGLEPLLEWLPFRLARLLIHGFGLCYTIAYRD